MDFRWTEDDEAFRQELRQFIKETLPPDWMGFGEDATESWEFAQSVRRKLGERGWRTMAWPKEYGGQDASYWKQLLYKQEAGIARLPGTNDLAITTAGPTIMIYGNDEQKARFLPGIASGENYFCQMFSEPGAGSDLASLQTRAIRQGDDYIVNGGKTFTSGAHHANFGWLAARTDPDAPKHRGISTFVCPTDLPGITIVPLINVNNEHSLNQVFFDNVRLSREYLVGEENRGWYQVMTSLNLERSGIERWAPAKRLLDDYTEYVREQRGSNPVSQQLRYKLTDYLVMGEVGRYLAYRVTDLQTRGIIASHEASMSKIINIYFYQGIAQLGVNLLGMYGELKPGSKWAKLRGQVEYNYIGTIPTSISGGSLEIQKNIVAARGLDLPR